MKELGKES